MIVVSLIFRAKTEKTLTKIAFHCVNYSNAKEIMINIMI